MMERRDNNAVGLRAPSVSPLLTGGLTALGLVAAIFAAVTLPDKSFPVAAKFFTIAWLAVSVAVTLIVTPRNFTAGFLGGLFAMLVGWRIAGLLGVNGVSISLVPAFLAFVLQFLDCVRDDLRRGAEALLDAAEWRLAFIRLYIGFDLVPHFTEKLFAGPAPFQGDVEAFAGFGLPAPAAFVLLGGLCEFAASVGIGMGVLMRLAASGAILYFLIATLIGGHFLLGFIWASAGGGWEYPLLMMVLFLTFAVGGGGAFSLDRALGIADWLPKALRPLVTPRASTAARTG